MVGALFKIHYIDTIYYIILLFGTKLLLTKIPNGTKTIYPIRYIGHSFLYSIYFFTELFFELVAKEKKGYKLKENEVTEFLHLPIGNTKYL